MRPWTASLRPWTAGLSLWTASLRLWTADVRCRIDVVARLPTRLAVTLVAAAALLAACSAMPGGGRDGTPELTAAPEATWTAPGDVDLTDPGQYAAALEDGVNAARAQVGVPELEHDDCLQPVAVERAAALVGAPKLVHAPLPPVRKSCPGGLVAENLSRTANPPQDVVQAWLDSPSHRDNLVSTEVQRGAIGCVVDGGTVEAPVLVCSHLFLD
ncbi:Cysteine-rich secretory protein family protein [Promicromonospora sp. AC04]|nr:Cysteine-rich secretory protein family protein [Promicromonospora sp. AC04]